MTIQNLYPNIDPTLMLDFANVKALDPRITFVRTTTATYYGTETAKAEENLLLQSQDFTTTWANLGSTDTANTDTAPDGTTTADTITEDSNLQLHIVSQTVSALGQITLSVFAKNGSGSRFLNFGVNNGVSNFASATFNLSLGTSTQTQVAGTYSSQSATITASTQGFYRCTLTVTTNSVTQVRICLSDTDTPSSANRGTGATYTGDDTSSLILWGCQLEQRSAVTSYTPTTTQPITNYIPVLEVAAAGEARFDHNPLTFESLGLLVEEQRTNLLLRSEEFDNAGWTKSNTTITANTIVAPSGELTGDKFVANNGISSSSSSLRSANFSKAASPVTFAFSIYAKAGEHNTLRLLPRDPATTGNNADVRFNLTNGTVISAVAAGTYTAVSGAITSVGNDWYRCTALFTTGSETTVRSQVLQLNNNASFTGDGFSGIFIWGAQLEAGAFPTSYIQTVAATVTRNADAASMTGTNFSSWYRADEGSFFYEFLRSLSPTGTHTVFAARQTSTLTSRIAGIFTTAGPGTMRGFVADNNVTQADMFTTQYSTSSPNKFSMAYKTNDFGASGNGGAAVTDASGTVPTVEELRIGRSGTSDQLNGHIRKIAFYPARLSNAQLAALTTV